MIDDVLEPFWGRRYPVWTYAVGAGLASQLVLFLDHSYGYPPVLGVLVCFLGHVPFFLADDRLTRFGFWLFVIVEAATLLLTFQGVLGDIGWELRTAATAAAAAGAGLGRGWRQRLDQRA